MKKPLNAHIFDRSDDEWYVEPRWVSDALFDVEKFDGGVWDPACGQGNIVQAALDADLRAFANDICPRWNMAGMDDSDFMLSTVLRAPNIVTNPPFGRAILGEKFIRHALSLKPQKLAVFVESRFLFGKARASGLYAEFPPARILLITPRPSCPPGAWLLASNKAGGGTRDYVWMVWDLENYERGFTSIGWLRCAP